MGLPNHHDEGADADEGNGARIWHYRRLPEQRRAHAQTATRENVMRLKRRDRSMDTSALASAEAWLSVIGTAKLVATFLVAIGVVIEFGGDWISRPFERVVTEAREQQLVALRAETARLAAEAEGAKAQIADAQAKAADANQKAEAERLERLKIEARLAPRDLSGEQRREFVRAISPFKGTSFGIAEIDNSPECLRISGMIATALIEGGWVLSGTAQLSQSVAVEGILIDADSEGEVAARKLADALSAAAIAGGLQPGAFRTLWQNAGMKVGGIGAPALKLIIGSKP